MNFIRALLLLVVGIAHAHIPLSAEILDVAVEDIERAQAAADAETDAAKKASAIFEFATQAHGLMLLLNQDIQLHGWEQQALLDEAVFRAAELGIEISWSEDHQRYFYSGRAYRKYLHIMPDGINAANSRYQLIETAFYRGDAGNREDLVAQVATQKDFLQRHSEFGNAGRVAMFLAINYRDLWRLCHTTDDADCADHYATLSREHLKAISAQYAGDTIGQLAQTQLQRFEAEVAEAK